MFTLKTLALAAAATAMLAAAPAGARPNIGTSTAKTCSGVVCMTSFDTSVRNEYQRQMRFSYRGRLDVKYYRVSFVDKVHGKVVRTVTVINDSSNFESRNWTINVAPNQAYNFKVQACDANGNCTTWGNFNFRTRA
jgi:hypothetical protein